MIAIIFEAISDDSKLIHKDSQIKRTKKIKKNY